MKKLNLLWTFTCLAKKNDSQNGNIIYHGIYSRHTGGALDFSGQQWKG